MRVFFVGAAVAVSLLVAACSGGDKPLLRRSQSASAEATTPTTGPNKASDRGGSDSPTPAPSDPPSSSTTPPAPAPAAPDAGTTPPAAPAGSCESPKCFAGGGLCGCKATDAQGAAITLGCEDGSCGCFTNNQLTAQGNAPCATADEARALFIDSCGCQ